MIPNMNMTTTSKWDLLPPTHPTVVRRLAKALNQHGWLASRSFYTQGGKWTGARVRKGQLEIGFCNENWTPANPEWHFDDGNGNAITAHRTVCGY